MCRSKASTDVIETKTPISSQVSAATNPFESSSRRRSFQAYRSAQGSSGDPSTGTSTGSSNNYKDSATRSSISSRASLSSLRDSLPENAYIYDFSEIRTATNNFSAKQFSSSSSSTSWRCLIGGKDVILFQRKLRRRIDTPEELRDRLSLICKSSHASLIKLRGASVSGNYIYLVYDYVHGANLADCLRNPRNLYFTVLSNWMSRMQIAANLAHGLDYLHHSTGLSSNFVHNHIKSSSIIVTEPSLNAKICHFGTAELCGEVAREGEDEAASETGRFKRSGSGAMKFGGARGYMSPEFQSTGTPTQKSDVFAFGVVILELLSGQEPLKYKFDGENGYRRISLIDTAREAVGGSGGGGLRVWMDRRLKDSYPVEVAEKLVRVGLDCLEDDPERRPDMGWIAGRISKLYLESETWAKNMGVPTDFTVSLAPR